MYKRQQETVIEVNEEGSEAAAATGVIMTDGISHAEEFNLNRPFLFMIRDNLTKLVLFQGRVMDPSS